MRCVILLLLVVSFHVALYRLKGGYSLLKIHSSLPSSCALWKLQNQDLSDFQQIAHLLDQPFHFLSSGGTSFAFLGTDGHTILKLFKHQHLTQDSWLFRISLPGICDRFRIEKILFMEEKQHHKRTHFFFLSCKIAYEHLRQETGLLFLTLHKDPAYAKKVTLIDKLGFSLAIDLSETEFAIQRCVTPLFDYLLPLIHTGQIEHAQRTIDSLVSLLATRCTKGIADRDPHLGLNFGCIDAQTIEYDIGSFSWDPKLVDPCHIKKELFFATYELRQWLECHCPQLLEHLYEILMYYNYEIK